MEKPFDGLGHCLIVDAEPLSDGQVAHSKLLKLKCLRSDLLVGRRGSRIQNIRLERNLPKGSNSLRQCPPLHITRITEGQRLESTS